MGTRQPTEMKSANWQDVVHKTTITEHQKNHFHNQRPGNTHHRGPHMDNQPNSSGKKGPTAPLGYFLGTLWKNNLSVKTVLTYCTEREGSHRNDRLNSFKLR